MNAGGTDHPYWQETREPETAQRSDRMVDVAFRMTCAYLPADHAYPLLRSVESLLPWLAETDEAGIHALPGVDAGGEPGPSGGGVIHLSRRVRLILRIPRARLDLCSRLSGATLNVGDAEVRVGPVKVREIGPCATLFSKRVLSARDEPETHFLDRVNDELVRLGVDARKRLPGRVSRVGTPAGTLYARSLLLADVPAPDSIRIQECGIGEQRALGCGLFVPHKSIAAVNRFAEQ